MTIEQLEDHAYDAMLHPVWRFLTPADPPVGADAIFVFGSLDLAVPVRAAELYHEGFSDRVLVTGRFGPRSRAVFDKAEALVFREVLLREGVPASAIAVEEQACNTLENVRFGMSTLHAAGLTVESAILVAKPFVIRRCAATFAQQFPGVRTYRCPPPGPMRRFIDRSRTEFAGRLLGELARLERYARSGHIIPQDVPDEVRQAAARIEALLS